MAGITISADDDQTAYAVGKPVSLTAKSDGHADQYQWKRNGLPIAGATNSVFDFEMTADDAATFVVTANVDGKPVDSAPIVLRLADASEPPAATPTTTPTTPTAPEPPPVLHPWFAAVVAIGFVIVAALIILGLNLLNGRGGFTDTVWTELEGRLKVGVIMALPLIVLGVVTLLTGLWMAVIEWRGRFKETEKPTRVTKGLPENPEKIIEAVGKLRGAALAMVIGAILLISAAWIGQAAAGAPAAPSSSGSPSATPAPSSSAAAP